MSTIGYRPVGGAADALALEVSNPYNYRAYIPDAPTVNGFAYSISMRTGKTGSTSPDMRGVVLKASTGNPTDVLAQTATFNPSVVMTGGGDGQWRTDNLTSALPVSANVPLGLGAIATGARALVGMIAAATLGVRDNRNFYSRDDGAMPPASPMGWTNQSFEGWMGISLNIDDNVAPDTPTGLKLNGSASTSQTIPTATPTIEWDFSDPNETAPNGLAADHLTKIDILVTRDSDGATMWNLASSPATSGEIAARHPSRTYAGTALASGVNYTLKVRHADYFGLKSGWSSTIGFVVGAGKMDPTAAGTGTPTGKQETVAPGPFVAKWTHSGGLSTTAVQVRLLDANNAPISGYQTGDIAKAVANNGNASATWAETAFASLSWGGSYNWQMRGKASDGNYSGWSASVPFTTDEAPAVPYSLTPDNIGTSSRPTLTAKTTDPDDTVATGLVVKAEIFNSSNALLGTYAMTLRSGTTDTWDLVTTATHLPGYDTYSWRAYAGDGTIWSGRQTVEANATRSATKQFTYAAGPSLAFTSPADGATIGTTTPTLTWTAATQAAYRVVITDVTSGVQKLDTGSLVSTAQSYTVPDGYVTENGHSYSFALTVTDASALSTTAVNTVTLTFTNPPAPAGWLVSPYSLPGDDGAAGEASAVLISFDPSADPNFDHYLLERMPSEGAPIEPNEAIRSNPWVALAKEYDVNTTRIIDYTPAAGVAYTYRLTVISKTGGVSLTSDPLTGEIMVTFAATILFDVADPEGTRVVLPYRGPRTVSRKRDQTFLAPWGRQAPTLLRSDAWSKIPTAAYPVVGDTQEAVNEVIRRLDYMDAFGADVCFRNGRGFRGFGAIGFDEQDSEGGGLRVVILSFTPTDYVEDAA